MSAPTGQQAPVARKKKPRWRIWVHAAKVVLWRRSAKLAKALGVLALIAAACVAVSYWSATASGPGVTAPTRGPMEQVAASCGVRRSLRRAVHHDAYSRRENHRREEHQGCGMRLSRAEGPSAYLQPDRRDPRARWRAE